VHCSNPRGTESKEISSKNGIKMMEKTFFLAEREPLVEKKDFFASFKTGFYLHVT